jgi:hypothetical protein
VAERSITGQELLGALLEVIVEIVQRGTVFLVSRGNALESSGLIGGLVNGPGEILFVLGPVQTLGRVFGLIDEEYGWPYPIQLSEVEALSDLTPDHRRHPMIWCGNDCLAMCISLGEYELLKGKQP